MKKYLIASLLLVSITFFSARTFSQGLAVNADASTADPSAMLDVKATNKGVLIPRIASTSAIALPVTGLLVYQTGVPAGFYYYNGTAWLLLQNSTGSAATLTTPRNINGVPFDGSADITIPIGVGAVTTTEILDGTIISADISPTAAIPYSKLLLTGSIQNSDIVAAAITTSKVANGTVTTSKMADSAISGLKLLTGAVTPRHISTIGASAGQAMIFDGTNVAWATPAGGGVPTGAAGGSLSGTYPNPVIAADAVTTTEILDGTIISADISPTAAIPYSKLLLTGSIQNSDIVANAITTSKVANGTVTTSKMADSAISGLKLLTGAVTPKHISTVGASAGQAMVFDGTNVAWTSPVGTPAGAAGGSLSGTYPNPAIAPGAVTTTEILDGTITGSDISPTAAIPYGALSLNNSIQNSDIVANAITTSKVANGTVTTSKMADSAISGLKLLTGAVTPKHISTVGAGTGQAMIFDGTNVAWSTPVGTPAGAAGGSLTGTYPNPSIAPGAVTTTEILDGTITGSNISPTAAIPYSALSLNNSIQNSDIVANAITTSKVANGTVTTSKMADSAISGLKLLTGAVTPTHISTVGASAGQAMIFDGTNVAWSTPVGTPAGAAGGSLTGTYPNPAIAPGAITTTEILDGTITGSDISATAAIPYGALSLANSIQNADITANAITTSKVADGSVTTGKMADSAISGLKLLTGAVTPKHISTVGAGTGQAMIFDGTNVAWSTPVGTPAGAAGGSLTGTYPNPAIALDAVTTTEILDGTITGSDISASAAIPYGALSLANSIQNADITANSITTSKVADGTVTTGKMADSAISGLKLSTGAVTPKHISTVGATAGQSMVFDGTNVNWATPAGGGGFPNVITDATALTPVTTTSSYQDMQSITLPSTGRYLITAFINITSDQALDQYNARITQDGTILTGSTDYYAADGMISLSTVVNITSGNLEMPLLIQSNNGGIASGIAIGTYSVVKLSN